MAKYITAFFVFALLKLISAQTDNLILSEIMFYPSTSNSEFIELYNMSSSESIDLTNFKIEYQTSSADLIIEHEQGILLEPMSYAVIMEGDYDFLSGIYKEIIDERSLVVKINNNSFGSSGMANSSDRTIRLLDSLDNVIDSVVYSADNNEGFSDEKIVLGEENQTSNWANSYVFNGTPGFVNSVSPVDYDLGIEELMLSPENIFEGETLNISVRIKNFGVQPASNYSITIYNDLNQNATGEPEETIFSDDYFNLSPLDSILVTVLFENVSAGIVYIIAQLYFDDDQNEFNNLCFSNITVLPRLNNFNDLVINEIMYSPPSGQPEWIELFNNTEEAVNLKRWKFADKSSKPTITDEDVYIPSKGYIILADDTSLTDYYTIPSEIIEFNLPSLNNGGDNLYLFDSLNCVIDSVNYFPEWGGGGGFSLERLSPVTGSNLPINWLTCIDSSGGTPGRENSNSLKDHDVAVTEILFSPEIPVIGDIVLISAKIINKGIYNETVSVLLSEDTDYDGNPDVLLETKINLNIFAGEELLFNFEYTVINIQQDKNFYVSAELPTDEDNSNNSLFSNISLPNDPFSVLINEIMFRPSNGEPEWVELYNNSNRIINLKNWVIKDIRTIPVAKIITTENLFVFPDSLYVISKDSTIADFHNSIPSGFTVCNFATLNNDEDGIVLFDNLSILIDSVHYTGDWESATGFSIEKKATKVSSLNKDNWGVSEDIEQSTPGRMNSVLLKTHDLAIANLLTEPLFPNEGESVRLTFTIKNRGLEPAEDFIIKTFYGSNQPYDLLEQISGLTLSVGDSLVITTGKSFTLTGSIAVVAEVEYSPDEDLTNNTVILTLNSGNSFGDILITEVMYNPYSELPEWVEFLNVSGEIINLKNWRIAEVLPELKKSILTENDLIIQPEQFFVVSTDSNITEVSGTAVLIIKNFGTLGNTGDGIVLYDFRETVIDSLFYDPHWGNEKGVSLERYSLEIATNDPINWIISINEPGSTPGFENSVWNAPSYNNGEVVINEIMYDPNEGNSEFIEIYNTSNNFIELGGWFLEDGNDKLITISKSSFTLSPYDYFTIASDSTIITNYYWLNNSDNLSVIQAELSLGNDGESLTLMDIHGNVIDSLFYLDEWNNPNMTFIKNHSLERLNPLLESSNSSNWSTSVADEGATPNKQNSVFVEKISPSTQISVSPNPFSPDNDGFEDFAVINYNLTQSIAQIRIKVYDSKGRKVRTIVSNKASSSSGSVVFDGLDENGNPLRIGIYILFMEAINSYSGVVETIKEPVVIARKL